MEEKQITPPELAAEIAQLKAEILNLRRRVISSEMEMQKMRKRLDAEIPEETLLVIAAAVSAYLGNRGKIKAVHFSRHKTWAAQGRQVVHSHGKL